MKAVLDTEISTIKQEIVSLQRGLSNMTTKADFQQLQQKMLNDLSGISKLFGDFGDEFSKHVTGEHTCCRIASQRWRKKLQMRMHSV